MKIAEVDISEKTSFTKIVELINQSKQRAFTSVNKELINLYWSIGEYISKKTESDGWGKGTVEKLSEFIQKEMIGSRGFSTQHLWRMKQFYETYTQFPKLSTLLRELSWTNNLIILSKTKSIEEKEFYLNLSIKEKYSTRELERQIKSSVFENFLLSNQNLSSLMTELKKDTSEKLSSPLTELENPFFQQVNEVFRDKYIFEFLDLPIDFNEKDLRKSFMSYF